ncbi:MAG TPA: hypothetical protein VFQ80_19360, partial [Thermomicrobiales bacterium]|nr:hypothetical protein [Thermomicrobiales bacterium]
DTDTDPNNCGKCGNECDPGASCVGGTCTSTCNDENCPASDCKQCDKSGECVNLCDPGETCDGQGHCVPSCGGDGDPCDGSNPCCGGLVCNKDTLTCQTSKSCNPACDKNNCEFCNEVTGTCLSACGANTTCNSQGQCVGSGGTCDAAHCDPNKCLQCNADGACEPLCVTGETCDGSGNCLPAGCTSDEQCGTGGMCIEGTCFVTSTCPAGESNLKCCYNAVHKACRHSGGGQGGHGNGGHPCRKKGKKRCRKNFGTT